MAAVGRTQETTIVNDNIYDNNAKEIDPAMVRAVLQSLIESNFNLVDDELANLKYSSSLTLAEKLQQSTALASGTINIGNATSQSVSTSFSVTGDFQSASVAAVSMGSDQLITVTFNSALSTNNYMPIIMVQSNSSNYDSDNDLVVSTFKSTTTNNFQIAIKKIASVTTNIKLYIKIFSM